MSDQHQSDYLLSWRIQRGYLGLTDSEIDQYEDWYWEWKEWRDATYGWWSERKWELVMGLRKPPEPFAEHPDPDELRALTTLSEVVMQYSPMKRTHEAQWAGKCPFHEDRSPSFSVDDAKGVWNCHAGCGGGNVYHFLMKAEQVDFKGALNLLSRCL